MMSLISIRGWRESVGMTLGELSRAARIDLVRLSEIEREKGAPGTEDEMDALAVVLEAASRGGY